MFIGKILDFFNFFNSWQYNMARFVREVQNYDENEL